MGRGQFDPLFIGVLVFLLGMVIARTMMDQVTDSSVLDTLGSGSCTGVAEGDERAAVCSALGVGEERNIQFGSADKCDPRPLTASEAETINMMLEGSFNKYAVMGQCYLGGLFGRGQIVCPFVDPDGNKCPTAKEYVEAEDKLAFIGYVNDEDCTKSGDPCDCNGDGTGVQGECDEGGFFCNNEPWQCFLIFGALPFAVIYFFMQDMIGFAGFFSSRTRKVLSLGVAAIATMSGGLTSVSQQMNTIVKLGVGGSFISLIFALGLFTALLGQFTSMTQQMTQARVAKYELTEGFDMMRDLGRRLTGREE